MKALINFAIFLFVPGGLWALFSFEPTLAFFALLLLGGVMAITIKKAGESMLLYAAVTMTTCFIFQAVKLHDLRPHLLVGACLMTSWYIWLQIWCKPKEVQNNESR